MTEAFRSRRWRQGFEAIHAWQVEVDKHDLGPEPIVGREATLGIQFAGHLVPRTLKHQPHSAEYVHVIIDEQYRIRHRGSLRSG